VLKRITAGLVGKKHGCLLALSRACGMGPLVIAILGCRNLLPAVITDNLWRGIGAIELDNQGHTPS
jgi:hypothetical protein